ncbi:MAG: hypothetical protein EPN97_17055 [Alphaproteobacteria bacterium]|nr:MAG: hypothetical protein EPN97_17055 [Alphaproteobacteria bacterium]
MTTDPKPGKPEEIPLREIFNAAVREAQTSFPALDGCFAVINLPDNRRHGSLDPGKTELNSESALQKALQKAVETSKKQKSSIATRTEGLSVIVYNPTASSDALFTTANMPKPMNVLAIFDHELGHLLIPDAMKNSTLSETLFSEAAADVYAVIRNIQRFGQHAQGASVISWKRAIGFVEHGVQSHFTFFALDELEQLQDRIDFKALTPQQSLQLARRVALQHAPHENLVRNLSEAFQPYRDVLKSHGRETALKVLMQITLAEESGYYAFRLGAQMLEKYLQGSVSVGGKKVLLEGLWWDEKRKELEQRLSRLDQEGILYGFPQMQNSPANTNTAPAPKKSWWRA